MSIDACLYFFTSIIICTHLTAELSSVMCLVLAKAQEMHIWLEMTWPLRQSWKFVGAGCWWCRLGCGKGLQVCSVSPETGLTQMWAHWASQGSLSRWVPWSCDLCLLPSASIVTNSMCCPHGWCWKSAYEPNEQNTQKNKNRMGNQLSKCWVRYIIWYVIWVIW